MPQSPFTGKFFQMTTFCIDFYQSNLSTDAKYQVLRPSLDIDNDDDVFLVNSYMYVQYIYIHRK